MVKFKVGDSVRFKKTGFTAKIVRIGFDERDPDVERYFLKVSKDDEELIVGEGNELIEMSLPVNKADDGLLEKI